MRNQHPERIMTEEELQVAVAKLTKHYQELVLPKIFNSPTIPTQKVKNCHASPSLVAGGELPVELADVLKDIHERTNGNTMFYGEAGDGKSTILAKIMEKWANGEITQFKVAFEINAKLLLSRWQTAYGTKILDEPLACFIHHVLRQSITQRDNRLSLEEVIEILNEPSLKGNILFAVDGLESVAHLWTDNPSTKFNEDQLLATDVLLDLFPRDNVVAATRPNILLSWQENYFPNKIGVIGLNPSEVTVYIQGYYSSQADNLIEVAAEYFDNEANVNNSGEGLIENLRASREPSAAEIINQLIRVKDFVGASLLDENTVNPYSFTNNKALSAAIRGYYKSMEQNLFNVLRNNPSIAKMAENPMMLMMILVLSEAKDAEKLDSASTVGEVFEKIVVLMSKIYISQKEDVGIESISDNTALELPEMSILKLIAYEVGHTGQISGRRIDQIIREKIEDSSYTIDNFYEFGALRVVSKQEEVAANNLLDNFFEIKSITLCAFLAASELVTRLSSDEEEIRLKAANFIADNRNDFQYLMLFKFAAGILAKDNSSQKAITIFYEAIQCNIPNRFVVGDGNRAITLMNILRQAVREDGEIDPRIPNLAESVKFINDVVQKNFNFWKYEINKSGFWDNSMNAYFWSVIERNFVNSESILDSIIDGHGGLRIAAQARSFHSFAPLTEEDKKEVSMLEMAGTIIGNINNDRLFKVLLQNINGNRKWEIIEASMTVIMKMIVVQKYSISSKNMSYILEKSNHFISYEELKGCAVKLINVLTITYKDDIEFSKSILVGLLAAFSEERDNKELYELIKDIVVRHGNELIDMSLDAFIPLLLLDSIKHEESSPDKSISLYRSLSFDDSIDLFDLVLGMVKEIIAAGNNDMDKMSLFRLFELLHECGNANGNIPKAIGGILSISSEETHKLIFERIINNLEKDAKIAISNAMTTELKLRSTKVVEAIISVLDAGVEVRTEFAGPILSGLNRLLGLADNKNKIIEAISAVAAIATDIDLKLGDMLISSLEGFKGKYSSVYIAISRVAKNGEKEVIDKAIDIFFAAIDKDEVAIVIEPLSYLTSRKLSSALAKEMIDKLMPIMRDGNNDLGIILANLLSNNGEDFLDERYDFLDHLIEMLHKSESVEFHKNAASAVYITCKDDSDLKSLIINALVRVLKSIKIAAKSDANKEIKTNIILLLTKITKAADDESAKDLFALYRVMLEEDTCDRDVLKNAIAEIAIFNQDLAYEMLDSLLLLVDHPDLNIASLAIYSLGKIATKQVIDANKSNVLLSKLFIHLDNKDLKLSSVYSINKILKNLEDWSSFVDQVPLFLPFLDAETKGYSYATGIIAEIVEYEQVGDELLVEILDKLKILLSSNLDKREILVAIHKVVGVMGLNNAVEFLQDSSSDIREIVVEQVTKKLQVESLNKVGKKDLVNMLKNLRELNPSDTWIEIINHMLNVMGVDELSHISSVMKIKYLFKSMGIDNGEFSFLDNSFNKIDKDFSFKLVKLVFTSMFENSINVDKEFAKKCLEELTVYLNDCWAGNIENMLTIVGNDSETDDDESLNILYKEASKRVSVLVKEMDEEEVNLVYLNENFERLAKAAGSLASQMMEQVIHSLLEDNEITINEREYIEKCIIEFSSTWGMSVVPKGLNSSVKFVIYFGNKVYYLTGEKNRENLEHIANTVLLSDGGILAKQYEENNPVFYNSESAIKRAAVDVRECKGLLTGVPLEIGKWQSAWIYESNDRRDYPESASLVLFTRETGGHFVGYKITISPVTGKVTLTTHRENPDLIDAEFKGDIFGPMEHDIETGIKARIFSWKIDIPYEQGMEMIDKARGSISRREEFAAMGEQERQSVFRLSDLVPDVNIRGVYNRVRGGAEKAVRKDCVKSLMNFVIKYVPDIIEQGVTASWKIDSQEFTLYRRALVDGDLERRSSYDVDSMLAVAAIRKDKKIGNEISVIEERPLANACYDELKRLLEGVYAEAMVLRPGNIHYDIEKSDVVKVGEVALDAAAFVVGAVVPGVGAGFGLMTGFLKKLINAYAEEEQKEKRENIVRFADGPGNMREIAEIISRYLSLHLDDFNTNEMDESLKGFFAKAMELANPIARLGLQNDIEGAVAVGIKAGVELAEDLVMDTVVDTIQNFGEEVNEATKDKEEGEKLAVILAQLIIKNIADGVYNEEFKFFNKNKNKAKLIRKDLVARYSKASVTSSFDDELDVDSITLEEKENEAEAIGSSVAIGKRPIENVPVVEEVGCTGWPSSGKKKSGNDNGKKNKKKDHGCIIMKVLIQRTDFHDRSEAIASLPKEYRVEALRKFGNPEDNESNLLNAVFGMKLLYMAKSSYGEEGFNRVLDLYKNEEVSESILAELKEDNIEQILSMLLNGLNRVDKLYENSYEKLLDLGHHNLQMVISHKGVEDCSEIVEENIFLNSYKEEGFVINIFESFISNILDKTDIKAYLLNYMYAKKMADIQLILSKEYILVSKVIGLKEVLQKSPLQWNKKDFGILYKAVHPDKSGDNEDFVKIREFQDVLGNSMFTEEFEKFIPSLQESIAQATLGFKIVDTATDGARLLYEPNFVHTKALVLDTTYLYSIYSGVNGYSSFITAADVSYKLYQGDYMEAMQHTASAAAYMALPSIVAATGIPYAGLFYSGSMLMYTGYSAMSNAYLFSQEFGSDDFNMKSEAAYQEMATSMSGFSFQTLFDFKEKDIEFDYEPMHNLTLIEDELLDITGVTDLSKGVDQ